MGSLQLRERLDALTVKKAQKPPDAALDPKVWSWLKDWEIKKLEVEKDILTSCRIDWTYLKLFENFRRFFRVFLQ